MRLPFKRLTLLIIYLCGATLAFGHNLKGTIVDKDGLAIPFVTVYIKEISLGTTTNEEGYFELELAPGQYTVNFRSMGYQPIFQNIVLSKSPLELHITLEEQAVQIKQIDVESGAEDPAYAIIRRVIGLSYVHLNQINSYSADIYIRGTVKMEAIPGFIRNQLKKRAININSGDVLVNETVSLINFTAPEKYTQQIKSINSTFPKEVDFSADKFLNSSMYQDNIDILFSPLGRNAFSNYNYRYEGYEHDGKNLVNKIKVIPKRKSKQLFEGYLYIIEDNWSLHRAELTFESPFGPVTLRLVYEEVVPGVWLPVGHDYAFKGGMMGVKASARFLASIQYNQIKPNEQVLAMAGLTPQVDKSRTPNEFSKPKAGVSTKGKSPTKNEVKITQLLEKDKLNNREMNKLSRLMAKADQSKLPDSLKTLEIKDQMQNQVDKNAFGRDTSYWTAMRPIPLTKEELHSFRERDSLVVIRKNLENPQVASGKPHLGLLYPLFFGMGHTMKDSTWTIEYDGLFSSKKGSFDAVDGWKITQDFTLSKILGTGRVLSFTPELAFAFGRKALLANGKLALSYAPLKRGILEIKGGRNTLDYNPENQIVDPFINSVASLFFKQNFGRFYESHYINLYNRVDLANGLTLSTTFKWDHQNPLENTTNFSFIRNNEEYRPNTPSNKEIQESALAEQTNTTAGIKIEYTPGYYYRINNGVKEMSHADYPTMFVEYRKGIRGLFSSTADFDYLGAGIAFRKELSPTSSIAYSVRGGWFPNNRQLHFSEFAHALTQTSPVLLHEYRHAFFLPGYYSLSTQNRYLEGHFSVRAPYLLFKYLPGLSNILWREMLWVSYYTSPQTPHYIEVGYTLLEVLLSANIGVHVGMNPGAPTTFGINLAFRISDLFSKKWNTSRPPVQSLQTVRSIVKF